MDHVSTVGELNKMSKEVNLTHDHICKNESTVSCFHMYSSPATKHRYFCKSSCFLLSAITPAQAIIPKESQMSSPAKLQINAIHKTL